jgi:hypothetical protein
VSWWEDYYGPLQQNVTEFRERHRDEFDAQELADCVSTEPLSFAKTVTGLLAVAGDPPQGLRDEHDSRPLTESHVHPRFARAAATLKTHSPRRPRTSGGASFIAMV